MLSIVNGRDQKYGFGGKEYNTELGLDWYDVSARNYDTTLGRWMNLDPLAEQMRRHSPYNFGFDNPIYFQDYDGMMPTGPGDGIKKNLKKSVKHIANDIKTEFNELGRAAGNLLSSIANYKFDGYDLRSLFSSGGDQSLKRKGNRETEVVDVTVIDIIIRLLSVTKNKVNNNKGTLKNTNKTKTLADGMSDAKTNKISRTHILAEKGVDTYSKMSKVSNSSTMNVETITEEESPGESITFTNVYRSNTKIIE